MRRSISDGMFVVGVALALWTGSAVESLAAAGELRMATFTCDVTVPLGQTLYNKPLVKIEHPLLAKGVVLENHGRRYVLCALDWCVLRNAAHTMFVTKIAAAAATEPRDVAVHCVHQHTAPIIDAKAEALLSAKKDSPPNVNLQFLDQSSSRVAAAAAEACKRLQPFDSVGLGQAKVDRVASCRRVPGPGGKILTRWSACKEPELRAMPEGPIDPILRTITLAAGGKPLARIHYYATHPQSFYGDGRASYDFPGMARERLQKEENVFQVYFTGCSGDVTAGKYNDGTPEARQQLFERIYAGMKAAVASTRTTPIDAIGWQVTAVRFQARVKPADAKSRPEDRKGTTKAPAREERLYAPIDVACLRIGPAWVLHLPGEPMNEFQRYAQSLRPGEFVAVAGYGQCNTGYVCTERAFTEGGYEPTASGVAPQSESVLKKAIASLLGKGPPGKR